MGEALLRFLAQARVAHASAEAQAGHESRYIKFFIDFLLVNYGQLKSEP